MSGIFRTLGLAAATAAALIVVAWVTLAPRKATTTNPVTVERVP